VLELALDDAFQSLSLSMQVEAAESTHPGIGRFGRGIVVRQVRAQLP
jgi:hypothetical protein